MIVRAGAPKVKPARRLDQLIVCCWNPPSGSEGLPPEDLWVTADYTLVRIHWDVFETSYELERLQGE